MKKIALIGTHGIGKTTICHSLVAALKEKGKNADYLIEIARDARNAGFRINEGTTNESQRWILHTQIARELEFGTREYIEILVCDRSILDNYVYYIKQFGADPILDQVVNEHIRSYDLLFKIPMKTYANTDGLRSNDKDFQREINELLEDELEKRGICFKDYKGIGPALELILQIV